MALTLDKPPIYDKLVDEKGNMAPSWRNWQSAHSDNLETYISQFGMTPPSLTTAQSTSTITIVGGVATSPQQGTLIFNTDTKEPQVFIGTTWRNITHT